MMVEEESAYLPPDYSNCKFNYLNLASSRHFNIFFLTYVFVQFRSIPRPSPSDVKDNKQSGSSSAAIPCVHRQSCY